MTAYFVTSTGTDIGKTFVTAGLIRHYRDNGMKASALKPIVSGFDLATAAVSDPGMLLEAMGTPITEEALNRISPFRFAAPLSPDMAAAREGLMLEFDDVMKVSRDAIAEHEGTFFIEGVGGVMVPLDARNTVLDWMRALGLPLIVVAGSYLGTISHTLTALDVLARSRLKVAALVINETGDGAVPMDETMSTLRRFVPGTRIVTIPRVKAPVMAKDAFAQLAKLL
jgi:dethiobiotin synthetase